MIDFSAHDIRDLMKPVKSTLEKIEREIVKAALNGKRVTDIKSRYIKRGETLLEFAAHYERLGFTTMIEDRKLIIKW